MIDWKWNEVYILEKNQQWNEAQKYICDELIKNQLDFKV